MTKVGACLSPGILLLQSLHFLLMESHCKEEMGRWRVSKSLEDVKVLGESKIKKSNVKEIL